MIKLEQYLIENIDDNIRLSPYDSTVSIVWLLLLGVANIIYYFELFELIYI